MLHILFLCSVGLQDQDDEQEGGGGGGGGGSGSSTSTKFANRLKEMGNEMKVGMTKLGEKKVRSSLNSSATVNISGPHYRSILT